MPLSQISVSDENKQKVLQCLRENSGCTVEQVADYCGRSVHWSRQLLRTMHSLKLVRVELDISPSAGPNRRVYYANLNYNRAPELISSGGSFSMNKFFTQLASANYAPRGLPLGRAIQTAGEVLARLIRESWRLSVGDKPTAAANKAQWRAQLIASLADAKAWIEMLESILSEPTWWNNDMLINVCNDPWIAENLSQAQCELIIKTILELREK